MEVFDLSLVNWSRAQFALTAIYHWLFVPLTLGLSFIMAFMESIYYKTGDESWKRITKFWMTLFGINFAIGAATGIILEFEFGTNWSNYSWFVGDIFGAPLAIEGILAFFMESTFLAVMFFGWKRVSKKFHLVSTWLVAFGASLSALWILVANAWMQFPTGMKFNPDTARNEMTSFWDVFLSPVAVNKFLHTITSGFVLASVFVIGVSCWYLIRKREKSFALRSIVIASAFGLVSSIWLAVTGDGSAYQVAQKQPMKLAAMEGLYEGSNACGLSVFGILNTNKSCTNQEESFLFNIEIPYGLSYLANRDVNSFVPGITDLVEGNEEQGIESAESKMEKGKLAVNALAEYKVLKKQGQDEEAKEKLKILEDNWSYFGYGQLLKKEDLIPNVPIAFYSFRIMVGAGIFFILLFSVFLFLILTNKIEKVPLLYRVGLWSIPLAYISSICGWLVVEMGRQPWVIQDIMLTSTAVTKVNTSSVKLTFFMFAVLFTALAIAEVSILVNQIKKGPKD
jgi:cytochrome d ubiquinol oxidase subunit I